MSDFIPSDESLNGKRLISKKEANKLLKKLQMKYGAELQGIQDQIKEEMQTLGYVTPELHAKREILLDKIKDEEKRYA